MVEREERCWEVLEGKVRRWELLGDETRWWEMLKGAAGGDGAQATLQEAAEAAWCPNDVAGGSRGDGVPE